MQIKAPWTAKQVENMKIWQNSTNIHPFTCYNGHILTPTVDGWICSECPEYHQDWAWDFML